jgi:ABC-type lipoprotein export system ATPase subunit
MIELTSVSKTYSGANGKVQAVDKVSLKIEAGDFAALYGPSGCGKSTMLLMTGTLLAPDSGTIRLDGKEPYKMSAAGRADLRAATIGFIFQQFHLLPYLSVLDNVLVPSMGANISNARDKAAELLGNIGLKDRLDHVPGTLSVGEQQRVAFARAVIASPKILLADEPTGNLDEQNSAIILHALNEFAKSGGAVLMVTHDASARDAANRSIGMANGRLAN